MSEHIPFGEVMKSLRAHLGLSQSEFAAKLGWSKQRVSFMESGIFIPTVRTLYFISSVTGVPAAQIIKTVDKRKKLLRSHE